MWTVFASATLTIVAVAVVVRRGTGPAGVTATVAAAVVSVTVTAVIAAGRFPSGVPPRWGMSLLPFLIELAALAVLIARFAHRGRPGPAIAGAGMSGLATALLVLRLTSPSSWPAAIGSGGIWAVAAAMAGAVGLQLRRQDRRRERYAADARRAQRQRLARDLHDFVAHEVSEMVAGAQAGLVVGGDPAHSETLFRRIEQAGQHALAVLDRTVHMLEDPATPPGAGLADVPALVAGFGAAGPVRAVLDLDSALTATVPGAVSAVAFRTVAESLTNVRRHAPTATLVTVTVTRDGLDTLALTITNDLGTTAEKPPRAAPAGRGLPGLVAAAEAVGGRIQAGPHGAGWRLSARLPLGSVGSSRRDDTTGRS
jgi:signal transduction histidine kinase